MTWQINNPDNVAKEDDPPRGLRELPERLWQKALRELPERRWQQAARHANPDIGVVLWDDGKVTIYEWFEKKGAWWVVSEHGA